MNSTKPIQDNAQLAVRFLEESLLSIAGEISTFETKPDPDAESYFVTRGRRQMSPADFELASGIKDAKTLAAAMAQMWEERGEGALHSLSDKLADLAQNIKREEDQSEEVSPFVYVMY